MLSASSSLAASWRRSGSRPVRITLAPSPRARRAVSSPMPALPPIKTTVCPASSGSRLIRVAVVAVLMIPPIRQSQISFAYFLVLFSVSTCVMGKYEIARFGFLMARETRLHECLVAGCTVGVEVTEPPTTRAGVFCRVLDHELNVRLGPWYERLFAAEDFVVLLRWQMTVVQSGNDRAVGERKLRFAICVDCCIVTQHGGKTVEVSFLMGHRDELPVAIPSGNFGNVDRGNLSFGVSDSRCEEGDCTCQHCDCNQQHNYSFHNMLLPIDYATRPTGSVFTLITTLMLPRVALE